MNNIQGKIVVVTGASSGLGEATARKLADEGAVAVLAARRKERLEQVAKDIAARGGKASVHQVDVTDRAGMEALLNQAAAMHGRVDVLVNNAGLMAMAPLALRRVDEWDRMIDINLKGVLYGVAAALPIFEKQGNGHFINISSVAGIKVASGVGSVYSATKFAVKALSEGMRAEFAGKYRVTAIMPGYVESELKFGSGDETVRQAVVEAYKANAIPAESVANAVAYAIAQPDDTAINEIVLRPTVQEF